MKGVVFTEFIEMVSANFGEDMADDLIDACDLDSDGAYTSVGTYDYKELVQLVVQLSEKTDTPVPQLIHTFGRHLFSRFVVGYPQFIEGVPSAFEFLGSIENHIHIEVRKLYPDAELPTFSYAEAGPNQLDMTYRSKRPFADLAHGLIEGALEHWGGAYDLEIDDQSRDGETIVRFLITQKVVANA